ncbi:SDR family oxidoreductase [Mucilaginibacter achroorhodeus]|uniref:SDR family oxidoreductase n=1 Tax=Mucilaginibacter achroorhodeus TaxID=2599294 RepID=A0A563U9Q3_9SPHI|nr:SDR family oxidoreductase [Mucilaginibacter achroorhodeus]TWR28060.1 SDR family oxidoreductase [Mucilaginibacter achroorhodeus]
MKNQKVALITGANRGIGFETAKQLGEKGITVILTARNLDVANESAEKLKQQGIDAYGAKLEVTSADDRKALAAYIEDKFGKLDILINNAGVAPKRSLFVKTTVETTEEEFEYIFQTNFFAQVYLTNALLPLLKKSDAGRIVNLSSILGSLTMHSQPNSPIEAIKVLSYDASKAALNMFTNHLAIELADTNINVNSAHPGWVKTELGGTDVAPMEIVDGAKTSVELALIGEDGPNGGFYHLGEQLPW